MQAPDPLEQIIGVKASAIILGGLGAIIQLAMHPRLKLTGAVVSVVAGLSCAILVPPLVSHYYELAAPVERALIFLCGLLGMSMIAKLYIWFSELNLREFFSRILNIK